MKPGGALAREYARSSRDVELARIRLAPRSWCMHMSESIALLVVVGGRGSARIRGETIDLAPGETCWCEPMHLAAIRTGHGELELVIVHVPDGTRASSGWAEPGSAAHERALAAVHGWSGGEVDETAWALDDLPKIVPPRGARRDGSTSALEAGPVLRARKYLEEHHGETTLLDELAAHAGVSKFHLVRLFRAHHGVPPHTYLLALRIALARSMLAAGVRGLEVAMATGFADQSHFSRSFRSIVGISPFDYARLSGRTRTSCVMRRVSRDGRPTG
jgi:AraC-like DNA-binding protein